MASSKKIDPQNKFKSQLKEINDRQLLIQKIFNHEFKDEYQEFFIKEISLLHPNELAYFFHEIILDKTDHSLNITFKFKKDF